jgi:hypothetical protein
MSSENLAAGMAKQLADIMARYQQHQAKLRQQPKRTASMDVLSSADLARAIKPRWQVALNEVDRDPVRFALRASVREIGWHAYASGGLELMHKVSDLMEETGVGGATLDKWWDGIGGPKGTWVA